MKKREGLGPILGAENAGELVVTSINGSEPNGSGAHRRVLHRAAKLLADLEDIGLSGEVQLDVRPGVRKALIQATGSNKQFEIHWRTEWIRNYYDVGVRLPDVDRFGTGLPAASANRNTFALLRPAIRQILANVVWDRLNPENPTQSYARGLGDSRLELNLGGASLALPFQSPSFTGFPFSGKWRLVDWRSSGSGLFQKFLADRLTEDLGRPIGEAIDEFVDELESRTDAYLPALGE